MLKIRRPLGRLIFNMGIAIPGKTVFLIETAPWRLSILIISSALVPVITWRQFITWTNGCRYLTWGTEIDMDEFVLLNGYVNTYIRFDKCPRKGDIFAQWWVYISTPTCITFMLIHLTISNHNVCCYGSQAYRILRHRIWPTCTTAGVDPIRALRHVRSKTSLLGCVAPVTINGPEPGWTRCLFQ